MMPTLFGYIGALVYTRRGGVVRRQHAIQGSGAAMKGELSGGKRGAASRASGEGDTSATRRVPARTLGQMTTVTQRQTQLIPQPPASRALTPIAPASRRSLLPPKAT